MPCRSHPQKAFSAKGRFTLKNFPQCVYVSVGKTSDPPTRHEIIMGKKKPITFRLIYQVKKERACDVTMPEALLI